MIKTISKIITIGRWENKGGGFKSEALSSLDNEVNEFMSEHPDATVLQYNTIPIFRHNNGGYDEILASYSIVYK